MVDDEKDVEEGDRGLIEVLSLQFLNGLRKTTKAG
jgi:hypothetical protein